MNSKTITKWIRLVIAVALGTPIALAAGANVDAVDITPPPGYPSATLQAPPFHTAFEIDGDKVPDNDPSTASPQIDWNDLLTFAGTGTGGTFTVNPALPGPYTTPNKPGFVGVQSTGIIAAAGATDPDVAPGVLCGSGEDATGFPGSTTIDSYPWADNIGVQNTNNKSDICTAAVAWEIVRVSQGTPGASGYYDQNHVMLYQYWTRSYDASGEITVFEAFDAGLPGNCGDFLVAFDYDSSGKDIVDYRTYKWVDANGEQPGSACTGAGAWQIANPDVTGGEGAAGGNTDVLPAGETPSQGTFGESAIDLTAAGILPQGECRTFTTGDLVIKTGQSDGAQLLDVIGMPPLQISNCGPVQVAKTSVPTGITSASTFTYDLFQDDLQPTHDASLTGTSAPESVLGDNARVTDSITIGATHVWNNVVAQSDYKLEERVPLPTGWQLQSIVCTFANAFLPGRPVQTATIYQNGAYTAARFMVFPPQMGLQTPSCVITNSTSGIVITKAGSGSPTTFDFTANGQPVSVALSASSAVIPFTPGTSVTLTELVEVATPGWALTGIDCDDSANAVAVGSSITVSTVGGTVITCTFTNVQKGRIAVDKTGLPADSTQGFDFSISGPTTTPNLVGLTISGLAATTGDLTPGVYTITELSPPNDADWSLVDIVCDNETNQNLGAQSVQVTVAPGANVNCTFANNQRGPVTIDKTAVLVDPAPIEGTINEFNVRYTVTATSASYIAENISVTDAFAFPAAITVVSGPTVSGASSALGWTGSAPNTNLYAGPIAARGTLTWTIDVRVRLDLNSPATDRDCDASGSGAWNDVSVAVDSVTVDTDDACVPFGNPNIDVAKSVVGSVTVNPDKSMSVVYSINVTNAGTGPGSYQLADTFGFPAWVTVTSTSGANSGVGSVPISTTLVGASTGPAGIGAGGSHTYTVTVNFTAAPTATTANAGCVAATTGNGLFNLASITSTSGPDIDDACINIPRGRLVVTKGTFGGTGAFSFGSDVSLINGGEITTTTTNGVASGNTLSGWVTPGGYSVTEDGEAGWTKLAQPCGSSSAVVVDGQTTTCAFTNGKQSTIKVVKVADPAGSFDFTLSGRPTQTVPSGPTGFTWTALDKGNYDLTEAVPTAWRLLGIDCGDAPTTEITDGKTIALDWGQNITCTFSDEAFGEIIVVKSTLPANTPATLKFAFNPSWSVDNLAVGNGEQVSSGQLVAGSYNVAEIVPAGWDLTGLACVATSTLKDPNNGSAATTSLVTASAAVTLEPGDTVTCTFTNTQRGQIIVRKDVPDAAALGAARNQAFSFTQTGVFPVTTSFLLDDDGNDDDGILGTKTTEVKPGSYNIAETLPANWSLGSVDCDGLPVAATPNDVDVTVVPGGMVDCTFTNIPAPADVTINKSVVNVAVGYAWSFDFTIAPDPDGVDGQPAMKPAAGTGPTTVAISWNQLVPGQQYTITETLKDNWTQSGLVCAGLTDLDQNSTDNAVTFVATPGMSLSCSVTNTPDTPTIIVRKTTVGAAGTFAFTVTSPSPAQDPSKAFNIVVGADATVSSSSYNLLTGLTYSVNETDPGDIWAEGPLNCGAFGSGVGDGPVAVTVNAGDDVVCTITNSALGNVTVIKDVVGANGTFGFSMTPTPGPFSLTTVGGTANRDFLNLTPDTYTLVETDETADFDGTSLTCVSTVTGKVVPVDVGTLTATISLANGEWVTCTFTNTERAHILVNKVTNPSGNTTPFDFTLTPGNAFTLTDEGAPVDSGPIPSNTAYTLTESAEAGWVVTGFACTGGTGITYDVAVNDANGASATITPKPGETIMCTVTNNLRGPVTITKVANPDSVSRVDDVYTVVYDLTVGTQSYITENFTLNDTPAFAAGATIQSMVVDGPGVVDLDLGADGGEIISSTIDPGQTKVYTVTTTFRVAGSLSLSDRDCGGSGTATYNSATVTFGVAPGTANANDCVDLPDPSINITKLAVTNPAQPVYIGGNMYTVAYDITATNTGNGPGSYTLTEAPAFGAGITVLGISATSANGTVNPTFGIGNLVLASGVDLQAGQIDTYRVTVSFTIAGSATLSARDCNGSGTASYNSVSLTYNSVTGTPANDCVDLPDPNITVLKSATTDSATLVSGNTYRVIYTVTVDNIGAGPGAYTLVDTPDFGTGATITNVGVTGNGVNLNQTDGEPITIITDESINPDESAHVYTVTVTFTVDGSMTTTERTCSVEGGVAGQATYNGVRVDYNGDSDESNDCADIPEPNVTIDKVVDPQNPLVRNPNGTWTVAYLLKVTNGVGAGPAEYDLTDTFNFGANVTVGSVTLTAVDAPVGVGLNGSFNGSSSTGVVSNVDIDSNDTHVYRVTVTVSIAVAGANGDCGNVGGLVNTMSVSVRGEVPLTDGECASYSTLTLIKNLVNNDGGNAILTNFMLTAANEGTTISGISPVASAVPAGSYDLSETNVEGYSTDGFTCVGGIEAGDVVSVRLGANVTCTIVNDDIPVDLQLTKTDGGFAAVAGGAPIPYTITVQNIGIRDVDAGEPVTVTDVLPSFLSWATFTDTASIDCSQNGQTLTCVIAGSLVEVGDPAVVIAATVNVAPNAPAGQYVNKAWVTTQDDPACVGVGCVPPCPAGEVVNNNVDCEETPVDAAATITIVKTDNVAAGVAVEPGGSFSYTLVVTNNGPSTILPGLTVSDNLPAQLTLVSVVGGAGWTCNNVDPIACTYGPSLAPGATATTVTVNVGVAAGATGLNIVNVALATGTVDRDCSPPGCDMVTDDDDEITPLQANADLAIIKTASVSVVGAGGGFNWVLDITNNGPGTAINVIIGDVVPSQVTVTGVTSTQFTCGNVGNTVTCTKPTVAVGETGKVTITVTVPASAASGTITNIGTVTSDTPDPNLTNNSDDAAVSVVAQEAPPTTLPPVILPPTGSNSTSPVLQAAFMLILLGGAVLLITRRRRSEHLTME